MAEEIRRMYSIGDYVVYGDSDICRVTEIGVPEMNKNRGDGRLFYFLETQFYKGMIYAPVDTTVPMRLVIKREEALELIETMPFLTSDICLVSDKKKMIEHYDALMDEHTCRSLARTAKSIFEKYHTSGSRNKLPNSTEAMYYKKASELLFQELSVALNESVSEIQARIEAVCSPNEAMKWTL